MSLTIYQMEYSPFCIPITAALRSCGTVFETREIPNWDRTELLRLTNGAYFGILGNLTYANHNPLHPEQSALAKFNSTIAGYRLLRIV